MSGNQEDEGISLRINKVFKWKNLSRRNRLLLWKWTKGIFAILLTASGVSNYYGIKITRESVTNNTTQVAEIDSKVATQQTDIDACKKINEENASLKITIGDLVDKFDAFLKNPRSWRTREQLDKAILKAKTQVGKPIIQGAVATPNNPTTSIFQPTKGN